MKTFILFSNKQVKDFFKDIIYVDDGFSISAMVFGIFWALYHRMWRASAFILLLYWLLFLLLDTWLDAGLTLLLYTALTIYIGSAATNWYAIELLRRGYRAEAIVAASSIEDAELRYISQRANQNR